MKEIVKRLMLAIAITLVAFALASLGHAQQADEDPAPGTRQQQKPEAVPQSSGKHATSNPAQQNSPVNKSSAEANHDQTQEALAFTGRIVEQHGELGLAEQLGHRGGGAEGGGRERRDGHRVEGPRAAAVHRQELTPAVDQERLPGA